MFDKGTPIFVQIADQLAIQVAEGELVEGERVPSSDDLATYHRVNPSTSAKGLNVLIDHGLLEKRRGLGMFVIPGARNRLLDTRRNRFTSRYVAPMVTEAERLGIDIRALITLVRQTGAASPGTRE